MFQFQGRADVWNKTAVKQCCRWSALFHASAQPWNWNKTKLSTVGWNEALTVGSFVLFQFYFTMCDGLHRTTFVVRSSRWAEITVQCNKRTNGAFDGFYNFNVYNDFYRVTSLSVVCNVQSIWLNSKTYPHFLHHSVAKKLEPFVKMTERHFEEFQVTIQVIKTVSRFGLNLCFSRQQLRSPCTL